ncbi:MAG TPA: hypothetical protein IAC36_06350 [Candidatus Aphodomonas merdavium]|nr:hypothetical protein [Candidatus Aphodomonas merdavium]
MRKIICWLLVFTGMFAMAPCFSCAFAQTPMTWDEVLGQIEGGADTVTLRNAVEVPQGAVLAPEGTLTISGDGFAISGGLTVEKGTVIFKDVALTGKNGVDSENGGVALEVAPGAVAVLSGYSSATGGRAGATGMRGGDGIVLQGEKSGLILRGNAYASGGVGMETGGNGVTVAGCGVSLIATDSASLLGGAGMNTGGAGLSAPSCADITISGAARLAGGNGTISGGSALASLGCAVCEAVQAITISDETVLVGGVGWQGGSGVQIVRQAPGEEADLALEGACMLFGGSGIAGGFALDAESCSITCEGEITAMAGSYSQTQMQPLSLVNCTLLTDLNAITQAEGAQIATDPTLAVGEYVHNTLQQMDAQSRFVSVESVLDEEAMTTSLDGLKAEKDTLTQVYLNGSGYRTTLWNATYEKKLSFKERLMPGENGGRLVLIAQESVEYLTMESTIAALKKYVELGLDELALTMVEPIYYERVLALEPLLEAVEAYGEDKISHVIIGTADDCVIFRTQEGEWDYQETLMGEIIR